MRALTIFGSSLLLACTRPAPASDSAAPSSVEAPGFVVAEAPPPTAVVTPAPEPPPPAPRPAGWPAAALFPAGLDPGRATLAVGDHGDILLRHSVQDASLADVAARWAETMREGGFTAREPCTGTPKYECRWIGPDRTVDISAGPSGSGGGVDVAVHWLPVGHEPIARLPGPCVKPPKRTRDITVRSSAIDQDGEHREGSSHWQIDSDVGADLDGDGVPELYVPHAKAGRCPWDIPHDVYVMRGDCGHKVGTIVGTIDDATLLSRFEHGLRIIHTRASWASHGREHPEPVHHTRTWTYTFDGRRFEQTDASAGDGICHHCGVTSCSET